MPIQVTCRHCLKRFNVSEKFAGQTGPCPSCKKPIEIPQADEQVVVHAPVDDAPKDSKGQSVLKPITRQETDVTRKGLLITIGSVIALLVLALMLRLAGSENSGLVYIRLLGAFALAAPLAWAGYMFLYDQECEPYRGPELRNRVLVTSGAYGLLWCIYAFVPSYVMELDAANEMSVIVFGISLMVMIVVGAIIAMATFELEFFSGVIHAALYVLVVAVAGWISGMIYFGQASENERPLTHRPAVIEDSQLSHWQAMKLPNIAAQDVAAQVSTATSKRAATIS
ncbi:hypothetical protein SV7mr_45590 [Stieleria bergensis]|uniref:Uncharacterized protein n=2 Tax=Stieleria bergensis TaxID=2528025 RepID=A0A517T0V5_9BACT|nr:hypothetical protein SV7mr_45590 [Planctomycetes bacterium SV_7m_r]